MGEKPDNSEIRVVLAKLNNPEPLPDHVTVRCVKCGREAQVTERATRGLTPDENGVYFGGCPKCFAGKRPRGEPS